MPLRKTVGRRLGCHGFFRPVCDHRVQPSRRRRMKLVFRRGDSCMIQQCMTTLAGVPAVFDKCARQRIHIYYMFSVAFSAHLFGTTCIHIVFVFPTPTPSPTLLCVLVQQVQHGVSPAFVCTQSAAAVARRGLDRGGGGQGSYLPLSV